MTNTNSNMRYSTILELFIFFFALSVSFFIHFGDWAIPFDDAFIHFRTALNWTRHGQPYYNIGEPVYSCSSPLWLMIIAVGDLLGCPVLTWTKALNSIFSVVAAWRWSSHLKIRLLRPVFGLAIWSTLLPVSTGLMETPLALILLELGLCRHDLRLPFRYTLLLLASMTRLECTVSLVLLSLEAVSPLQRGHLKHYLFPLTILILYLGFSYHFYGTPLPQTLAAKRIVYYVPAPAIASQLILFFIGEDAPHSLTTILYSLLAIITIFGALVPSLCRKIEFKRSLLTPALFSFSVFLGYCLNHILLFPWYVPLITVPALYSLTLLLSSSPQMTAKLFLLLVFTIYFLPLMRFGLSEAYLYQTSPWFPSSDRIKMLSQISQKIPATTLVAAPEIGVIGFSTNARIIDGVGLTTPEALRFHPLSIPSQRPDGLIGAIPFAFVADRKPDIVIGVSGLIEGSDDQYENLGYLKKEYPVFLPSDELHHLKPSYLSRQKIHVWVKNPR